MTQKKQVLLVGCGAMGSALNQRWSQQEDLTVTIIDPSIDTAIYSLKDIPASYQPDVIVFAIKPQIMPHVLPEYKRFANEQTLFISIAAGIDLKTIANYIGNNEFIVRSMPNLPATVGQGMTALISSKPLALSQKNTITTLFETVGQTVWLEEEHLIDAVTAISGSGPAYFFRLTECLIEAGVRQGLPKEVCALLASQTLIGAGAILQKSTFSANELRSKVTSPGGTTDAALKILDQDNTLSLLVNKAVEAAVHRAEELKKGETA